METKRIHLCTFKDIKDFSNVIVKIDGKATLSEGRYRIDAKSLIGLFSLDLRKQLKLEIENWKEEYAPLFEKYQVPDKI